MQLAARVRRDDPADSTCGPKRALWISEAGGLTQFGAFVEILPPRLALVHQALA